METETTLLITGATGMIGSSLVRQALEMKSFSRIVLPVRKMEKAEKMYGDLPGEDYRKLQFVETSMEHICPEQFSMPVDCLIHCACVTQSAEMVLHPVETADSIVMGTRKVLDLARIKQVRSMVYLSSMEVYGTVPDTGGTVGEDRFGEIDLKEPRSCYPMAKRMAEHYCCIYQKEYGVPVKIARLSQTFGKGVRPDDQRVYMQFARAVREKKDIVLHTQGYSMGNYCHIQDTVRAVFCILQHGQDGEAYNVVNEKNTMTVRQMAQMVAECLADGAIKVVFDIDRENRHGYARETGLRLSASKLRMLGWEPEKDLVEMYREVLEELRKEDG